MSRSLELVAHLAASVLAFALVIDVTSAGAVSAVLRYTVAALGR